MKNAIFNITSLLDKVVDLDEMSRILLSVRELSPSLKCKVGCIIATVTHNDKYRIIGVGYNNRGLAPMERCPHCEQPFTDLLHFDMERLCFNCNNSFVSMETHPEVVHAEVQAIEVMEEYMSFRDYLGKPKVAFVTRRPCENCLEELRIRDTNDIEVISVTELYKGRNNG